MAGYYIMLMTLLVAMVALGNYMITVRTNSSNREFKELALYMARTGFEDASSFFRKNASGMYIRYYATGASSQIYLTYTAYPDCPDWAFAPGSGDTDYFNAITVTAVDGTTIARAIIRDIPLHITTPAMPTPGTTLANAGLWGRYVVRRQVARNWSPGGNTMSVYSDPDAAHDITQNRDFSGGVGSNSVLGTGNYWSITSRGYVYSSPNAVSANASCENNDLTNAPRDTYLNKKFRLASAKVYGEIFRINFKIPSAALFVTKGNIVGGNAYGIVQGGSNYGIATGDNTAASNIVITGSAGQYLPNQVAPSVSTVFPGMTKAKLQKMADRVGDIGIFPTVTDTAHFTQDVSVVRFYYLQNGSSAFTFSAAVNNRFQGVGVVFVDGNLVINATAAAAANWAGLIFVDGTISMTGSVDIGGAVVATTAAAGGVVLSTGNTNKTTLEYNLDAINTVTSFLQDFKVYKPSVVASYN